MRAVVGSSILWRVGSGERVEEKKAKDPIEDMNFLNDVQRNEEQLESSMVGKVPQRETDEANPNGEDEDEVKKMNDSAEDEGIDEEVNLGYVLLSEVNARSDAVEDLVPTKAEGDEEQLCLPEISDGSPRPEDHREDRTVCCCSFPLSLTLSLLSSRQLLGNSTMESGRSDVS